MASQGWMSALKKAAAIKTSPRSWPQKPNWDDSLPACMPCTSPSSASPSISPPHLAPLCKATDQVSSPNNSSAYQASLATALLSMDAPVSYPGLEGRMLRQLIASLLLAEDSGTLCLSLALQAEQELCHDRLPVAAVSLEEGSGENDLEEEFLPQQMRQKTQRVSGDSVCSLDAASTPSLPHVPSSSAGDASYCSQPPRSSPPLESEGRGGAEEVEGRGGQVEDVELLREVERRDWQVLQKRQWRTFEVAARCELESKSDRSKRLRTDVGH